MIAIFRWIHYTLSVTQQGWRNERPDAWILQRTGTGASPTADSECDARGRSEGTAGVHWQPPRQVCLHVGLNIPGGPKNPDTAYLRLILCCFVFTEPEMQSRKQRQLHVGDHEGWCLPHVQSLAPASLPYSALRQILQPLLPPHSPNINPDHVWVLISSR